MTMDISTSFPQLRYVVRMWVIGSTVFKNSSEVKYFCLQTRVNRFVTMDFVIVCEHCDTFSFSAVRGKHEITPRAQ